MQNVEADVRFVIRSSASFVILHSSFCIPTRFPMLQPLFPPTRRPLKRPRRIPPPRPAPAPAAALTLVSATYVTGTSIELTFDRAIDIGGIAPDTIRVNDSGEFTTYLGLVASLASPESVELTLNGV